ncbi:hypothetical protein D3C75_949760 [compost metagenome]
MGRSEGSIAWQEMQQKKDDIDREIIRKEQKMRGEKVQSLRDKVVQSIKDMRRIYPELSDERFAQWYSRKFRVKADAVLKVLEGGE